MSDPKETKEKMTPKSDDSKANDSKLFPSEPLPGFKEAEGKTTKEIEESVRKMFKSKETSKSTSVLEAMMDEVAALRSDVRTILEWDGNATTPLNEMRKQLADITEWSNRLTETFNAFINSWNAFAESAAKQPNVADALQKWLPQITQEQERMDRVERYVGACYKLLKDMAESKDKKKS